MKAELFSAHLGIKTRGARCWRTDLRAKNVNEASWRCFYRVSTTQLLHISWRSTKHLLCPTTYYRCSTAHS
jgi:hypothetical protein